MFLRKTILFALGLCFLFLALAVTGGELQSAVLLEDSDHVLTAFFFGATLVFLSVVLFLLAIRKPADGDGGYPSGVWADIDPDCRD